ncbi:MAG: FxsA family protein [Planctomycetia bacterium]|nr:FxsA family protein [Planctomycetia bacterium]
MAIFFICFIVLPAAELALFIWLALKFGWISMLALTLLTTFLGVTLHRLQRRNLHNNMASLLKSGNLSSSLVDMTLSALAPWFLIFPGFITDVAGLCLLLKPVRRLFYRLSQTRLLRRFFPSPFAAAAGFSGFQGGGGFGPSSSRGGEASASDRPGSGFDDLFNITPENYAEKMAKLRPLLDDIFSAAPNRADDWEDDDYDEEEDEIDISDLTGRRQSGRPVLSVRTAPDDADSDDIIDADYTIKRP